MTPPDLDVLVVGGAASGLLTAAHLGRAALRPIRVAVVEPEAELGRGPAYGTTDPRHLLNVPARGMSALPEDPDHFRRWAGCEPTDFLPRARYAAYLRDVLEECWTAPRAGAVLEHRRARVVSLEGGATGTDGPVEAVLDDGSRLRAATVVLATGHGAAVAPEWLPAEVLASPRCVADPWSADLAAGLPDDAHVVCIGSGLTFVDVALSVLAAGSRTRVTALSRHGMLPRAHVVPLPVPDAPLPLPDGPLRLAPLVRSVRARAPHWREAVDGLRPQSADIWRRLDPGDRDRFMRHLRPYWEVHRHRAAPTAAAAVEAAAAQGRLRVLAVDAPDAAVTPSGIGLRLPHEVLRADRLVLCTGPSADVGAGDPGRGLLRRGRARRGPYGLGYDVDPRTGALLDVDGRPDERLVAMGPLRRGVLGESTAIPEVRAQAADLAARLCDSG